MKKLKLFEFVWKKVEKLNWMKNKIEVDSLAFNVSSVRRPKTWIDVRTYKCNIWNSGALCFLQLRILKSSNESVGPLIGWKTKQLLTVSFLCSMDIQKGDTEWTLLFSQYVWTNFSVDWRVNRNRWIFFRKLDQFCFKNATANRLRVCFKPTSISMGWVDAWWIASNWWNTEQ